MGFLSDQSQPIPLLASPLKGEESVEQGMARVILSGTLKQLAGGASEIEVEARDIRQLLRALGERWPELAPHLESGYAIAIDGEIFQDAWFAPIRPDSEVHLVPAIRGG
jgi:molybdopterin synthase sulfur carrier subunit